MNTCEVNKCISKEVKNFILNVTDVKEESITDYLVWKWHEFDPKFNYINVTTFTRHEENKTTGADFELELWLVHRKYHFRLVFQAKKFTKPFDAYVNKLNYPAGTQGQMSTLFDYCKAPSDRLPFYLFYALQNETDLPRCPLDISETGIFIADAKTIKEYADGLHGRRVSVKDLLAASRPFHCMFCCPLALQGVYFKNYFPNLSEVANPLENKRLPSYVNVLLNGRLLEMGKQETFGLINEYALRTFRIIGVYDLREPNQAQRN